MIRWSVVDLDTYDYGRYGSRILLLVHTTMDDMEALAEIHSITGL